MKKINVGMVEGRHPLPVETYIFEEVRDVMDFKALEEGSDNFFEKLLTGEFVTVNLYVTGLTSVAIASMSAFAKYSREKDCLIFWHFNRETNGYVPQYFIK